MALNFPASPAVNDTYSIGDVVWYWNGTVWQRKISTSSTGATFSIPTSFTVRRQLFTATGSNSTVTLANAPTSVDNVVLYISGVEQPKGYYSLSGVTLYLGGIPAAGEEIEVLDFSSGAVLGAMNRIVQTFVATEGQTSVTSASTYTPALLDVYVNGVLLFTDEYTATDGTLVNFTDALEVGDEIKLVSYVTVSPDAVGFTIKKQSYIVSSATQSSFTVSSGYRIGYVDVYLNGVKLLDSSDYTAIDGNTVILASPAILQDVVEVQSYLTSSTGGSGSGTTTTYVNRKFTGNGSTSTVTLTSSSLTANSVLVFENGVCQMPGDDYTVAGGVLTFVTAPAAGVSVQIRELPV
jgi:hypothetical protein